MKKKQLLVIYLELQSAVCSSNKLHDRTIYHFQTPNHFPLRRLPRLTTLSSLSHHFIKNTRRFSLRIVFFPPEKSRRGSFYLKDSFQKNRWNVRSISCVYIDIYIIVRVMGCGVKLFCFSATTSAPNSKCSKESLTRSRNFGY